MLVVTLPAARALMVAKLSAEALVLRLLVVVAGFVMVRVPMAGDCPKNSLEACWCALSGV